MGTSRPRQERRQRPPGNVQRILASPRRIAAASGALLAVGLSFALLMNLQVSSARNPSPVSAAQASPGSQAAFTYLAAQHSNFCQLQKSTVMTYSAGMHLQGACCNPLDMVKYKSQVSGLRAYAGNADIAPDPYDIPVSLAKRLFGYDSMITLTTAQQAVYAKAISLTDDKAPCCCQCWRWYMTRGLAKSLIAQRGMGAFTVARIIDLSNGCGGPPNPVAAGSVRGAQPSP